MNIINLQAEDRTVLGKHVKKLRAVGKLPAHIFGKQVETEHITVDQKAFFVAFNEAGSTGVISLKVGADKTRPVMVKGVQYNPVSGNPIHIDFYQVNLSVKVTVPVPIELVGDETEKVKLGEAIVLQNLSELQVEALPNDLVEKIEVDISRLQNIDDHILVRDLSYDHEKLTVLTGEDEIVVKLAPAVSEEMQELLEEQAAETEAAQAEETTEETGEAKGDGESGDEATETETAEDGSQSTEKPVEEN